MARRTATAFARNKWRLFRRTNRPPPRKETSSSRRLRRRKKRQPRRVPKGKPPPTFTRRRRKRDAPRRVAPHRPTTTHVELQTKWERYVEPHNEVKTPPLNRLLLNRPVLKNPDMKNRVPKRSRKGARAKARKTSLPTRPTWPHLTAPPSPRRWSREEEPVPSARGLWRLPPRSGAGKDGTTTRIPLWTRIRHVRWMRMRRSTKVVRPLAEVPPLLRTKRKCRARTKRVAARRLFSCPSRRNTPHRRLRRYPAWRSSASRPRPG
mmetsp:Transcript_7724/g.25735  ORF Transcript_7724/g.25735 Transcript_7724/m.25735 type:complete len:264 (+) Transcript_7724:2414-3205(+)